MKANELRIGNWFKTFEIDKNHGEEYFQVETLTTNNEGSLGVGFRNESCWSIIELIEPIPLTEEWSVKFGYECLVDMACDFSCKSLYPIEITSEDLKLMKVNEAQNLYFALTGEELTIKE
jgi:hypothetical protein